MVMEETGPGPQVCDHEEACGCYVEGYTQGKDKAHFEIRHIRDAGHVGDCGCEPCKTVREVVRWVDSGWWLGDVRHDPQPRRG